MVIIQGQDSRKRLPARSRILDGTFTPLWYSAFAAAATNALGAEGFRGNHLSNPTCLTQVFFKSCESCGKFK